MYDVDGYQPIGVEIDPDGAAVLFTRPLVALCASLLLLAPGTTTAHAHARCERSDPPAGAIVDGAPFVLRAWFSQERVSRSSLTVTDEAGTRVDLGDGRVDLDDPDRKLMLVSLPAMSVGIYTVRWSTLSAEDGDTVTN